MKTIEIPVLTQFSGLTIDELLETWLIPRKERYLLRVEKRLALNGGCVSFSEKVKTEDLVTVRFKEPASDLKFGNSELAEILYEDENVIVVNKPCGMKTHGNDSEEIALQNHVAAYCKKSVFVVHRLDCETSGAVLFAKNNFVQPILCTLLEQRKIHREYLALVTGKFDKTSFTIDQKIGRDRHDRRKRCISASGQTAITQVELLQSFAKSSLIKCVLKTGRTHQIRVHLAGAGHPIVGDSLYGGPVKTADERMMLHASKIRLTQPFTFEQMEIFAISKTFEKRIFLEN